MNRFFCFFLFFFISFSAFAETKEKSDSSLVVNPNNLANYYDQLISPLIPLIKDQKIIVPLASGKDLDFSLSKEFLEASTQNAANSFLDDKNQLQFNQTNSVPYVVSYALPFGQAKEINSEVNPTIKGYKILWNLSFAQNQEQDSYYQLAVHWFGSQALFKSASASYYRKTFSFPSEQQGNTEKTNLLDQPLQQLEILNFKSPEVINGYLEFSKRYFSKFADQHWIFSTINKKLRSVPSSLRSDKILECGISFDDLLNFSNKIQDLGIKTLEEKTILIPLSSLNTYPLELYNLDVKEEANFSESSRKQDLPKAKQAPNQNNKYLTVRGDKETTNGISQFVLFNHESNQNLQLSPWAPVNLVFVPRKVWVLEIFPLDPFYSNGKEVLYIDQETFLPFYKIIYNLIGEPKKTVISSWAKAETKNQKISLFFNTFNLAFDNSKQTACSTVTESVQTFQGKENQKTKELMNLINLDNYKKEEKIEKPKPKKLENYKELEHRDRD